MNPNLTKKQQNRLLNVIKTLKSGKVTLGRGSLYDRETNRCCALGYLAKRVGFTKEQLEGKTPKSLPDEVEKAYGLNEEQQDRIVIANDSTHFPKQAAQRVVWFLNRVVEGTDEFTRALSDY